MSLQKTHEFLRENLVTARKALRPGRETIVGDNSGDRRKKTHSGRNQGLGNPRRHHGQGGLLNVPQRPEGIHDAPNSTEQTDIGTSGTDSRKKGKSFIDAVHLS